mmetsp:Transcript_89328/g.242215  ORF Transcript_89328/g.242215 Transcript_89328/m.242215 type:complete len:330 (-) Transcript_89328:75-1064(-)
MLHEVGEEGHPGAPLHPDLCGEGHVRLPSRGCRQPPPFPRRQAPRLPARRADGLHCHGGAARIGLEHLLAGARADHRGLRADGHVPDALRTGPHPHGGRSGADPPGRQAREPPLPRRRPRQRPGAHRLRAVLPRAAAGPEPRHRRDGAVHGPRGRDGLLLDAGGHLVRWGAAVHRADWEASVEVHARRRIATTAEVLHHARQVGRGFQWRGHRRGASPRRGAAQAAAGRGPHPADHRPGRRWSRVAVQRLAERQGHRLAGRPDHPGGAQLVRVRPPGRRRHADGEAGHHHGRRARRGGRRRAGGHQRAQRLLHDAARRFGRRTTNAAQT